MREGLAMRMSVQSITMQQFPNNETRKRERALVFVAGRDSRHALFIQDNIKEMSKCDPPQDFGHFGDDRRTTR